jgi:hypothetical protein
MRYRHLCVDYMVLKLFFNWSVFKPSLRGCALTFAPRRKSRKKSTLLMEWQLKRQIFSLCYERFNSVNRLIQIFFDLKAKKANVLDTTRLTLTISEEAYDDFGYRRKCRKRKCRTTRKIISQG